MEDVLNSTVFFAISLEEPITAGEERFSSGDHEPEDAALAGLPPDGPTISSELRATGGWNWQAVVLCGVLRGRPLFSSGRLPADDDEHHFFFNYKQIFFFSEVKTTYRPDIWTHNGPGVITRVLHKICQSSTLADWSSDTCQGLEVYGPEYFYPIHYSRKDDYFHPGELQNVENAYTHHFWNKLTFDMKIEKDSPYDKMAKEFCPTIYEMYGDEFGS